MMRTLTLIMALTILHSCYAQDGMDAVFKVQKKAKIVVEDTVKRPILFSYTYRDYPYTFQDYVSYTKGTPIGRDAFVAFKGDTMLVYTAATAYKVVDEDSLKYADPLKDFKVAAKLVFSKKDSIVYCDRFYADGTNSGAMEIFSMNKKRRMNDAFSIMCLFNETRNCPAHNSVQFIGYDSLTVGDITFNCIKVEAMGERFMPAKKNTGGATSKGRVATKVVYYFDEKTMLPVLMTENCGDKNTPCSYSWQLSEILK